MSGVCLLRMAVVVMTTGLAVAASAGEMEVRWNLKDGRAVTERRALSETNGVAVFTLKKDEIVFRNVKSVELTPDFARAKKGDKGFWAVSSGETGTFRCDEGKLDCNRWQLMSFYGMQTPERTFVAIVRKLKYYFTSRVVAEKGAYRMSCVLENEMASQPYEDLEIEFRRLEGNDASLAGMARAYRQYQLNRGAVKPLAERAKDNPVLKYAIEAPEVRIRQAWKPVPSPVPDQTPENEPPVKAVVPFDRVADIAREFKRQGVDKAEFCLVGWQIGGHDGRWPQVFPVEPSLGGEGRLRACIQSVKDLGYLIVPHGNYLDAYRIAESWDEEWLLKDLDGETTMNAGCWGGGSGRRICPRRAYERFMSREMPRMKALGFKGLGYFDVVSVVPARYCGDPRHPLNGAEAAYWWGKGAELSKSCFGGFASEGAFDHFAGSLDYGLYVTFNDPQAYPKGLVDRMAPLSQLVYNGIFASNPFTRTVNFTAQDRYCQLKLIEFGGRPAFYFYSKFVSNGKDWMGDNDLHSQTDEELRNSVARVKAGWDIYRQLNHLQFVYMDDHAEVAPGVWRTTYANGEQVIVNYNKTAVSVGKAEIPAEGWKLLTR